MPTKKRKEYLRDFFGLINDEITPVQFAILDSLASLIEHQKEMAQKIEYLEL